MPHADQERDALATRHLRHLPLAAVLCLFVAGDVIAARIVNAWPGDFLLGIIFGVCFAQVVLLAVWTTLAPATLLTRTFSGFGGIILLALAFVASMDHAGGAPEGYWFFGMVVTQWLVIQVPLWAFRLLFAWRLCWPGEEIASATRRDTQFGIGQLMMWTALVGVTLGIARLLIPEDFGPRQSNAFELLIIFGCLTLYNSLLAWPVVWAAFAPRWWPVWLAAAGACCVLLTVAEIKTFHAALGRRGDTSVFWVMNSMQAAVSGVALLAMRVSGFRLVRPSGSEN